MIIYRFQMRGLEIESNIKMEQRTGNSFTLEVNAFNQL